MKKILVPTDFSGMSRNAEEYAASLAQIFDAEVQLLHVYREALPASMGSEPWAVTISDAKVQNEKLLNKEVNYLKSKYAINIKAGVESGARSKTIIAAAKNISADLIIMGSRGGKRYRLLGSTVLKTIRKSKIPVLIVPGKTQFAPIKNILIAVDFTEMLDSACFDVLFEMNEKFSASVRVLHVEDRDAPMKASEVPEKLQLRLALSRFNCHYDKIESFEVGQGIQGFMAAHPTDLLVLIAHHHTIYERIFETTHTKSISFKNQHPLLVLKQINEY